MDASLYPAVACEDAVDEDFLRKLHRSVGPLMLVAAWAVRQGYTVRIPGMKVRPDRSQWRSYSDRGDLFVCRGEESERRIEVKSTSRDFTGPEDWPFPDMLVCAAKDWDDADPKPHRFVIVNASGTHAAVVRGDQLTEDRCRMQSDNGRGYAYPAYAIPPQELRFVELL